MIQLKVQPAVGGLLSPTENNNSAKSPQDPKKGHVGTAFYTKKRMNSGEVAITSAALKELHR